MTATQADILVFGFGNPARVDDGLGPAMVEALEVDPVAKVQLDSNYQLSVEDADAVARHEVVVFVDAATEGAEPFSFECVTPTRAISFSSHSVRPEALVALAEDLFDAKPRVYMLAIRGYEFNEFAERLSAGATANLRAAEAFLRERLARRDFAAAVSTTTPKPARVAS